MITIIVLFLLFGAGFAVTGALISAFFWLVIKLPLAVLSFALGIVCCCTIILIPVGIGLFKFGLGALLPGVGI